MTRDEHMAECLLGILREIGRDNEHHSLAVYSFKVDCSSSSLVWLVLVLFITADTKQSSTGGLQLLGPLLAS